MRSAFSDWQYFSHASTNGLNGNLTWERESFCPVFQERFLHGADRLLRSAEHAYPDPSAVWLGVAGDVSRPLITLATDHPYRKGFAVIDDRGRTELPARDARWPLDLSRGDHRAALHCLPITRRFPRVPRLPRRVEACPAIAH